MKPKAMSRFLILLAVATLAGLLYPPWVSGTPMLNSAQSFAVLGHETVTNGHSAPNPTTQIYGNVGVTPGLSVTGFYPDGTVSGGTIHVDDGAAQLALADATTAYNTLAGLPFTFDYTGVDLGSLTLTTPGVYHFDTSAQLTGTLTLDFQGNPNVDFTFQIGSTLTTASSASVNVINGTSTNGVYWQIGSSATLGSGTTFAGNILAQMSVTLDPTARILCGRAFGLTGAVTLTDNIISNDNSAEDFGSGRGDFGSYGFSGGDDTTTPTAFSTMVATSTPTGTSTSTMPPTSTPTGTSTSTMPPTSTPTGTSTSMMPPTSTPTATSPPSPIVTPTQTPTRTATGTPRLTRTPTRTGTRTPTATATPRGSVLHAPWWFASCSYYADAYIEVKNTTNAEVVVAPVLYVTGMDDVSLGSVTMDPIVLPPHGAASVNVWPYVTHFGHSVYGGAELILQGKASDVVANLTTFSHSTSQSFDAVFSDPTQYKGRILHSAWWCVSSYYDWDSSIEIKNTLNKAITVNGRLYPTNGVGYLELPTLSIPAHETRYTTIRQYEGDLGPQGAFYYGGAEIWSSAGPGSIVANITTAIGISASMPRSWILACMCLLDYILPGGSRRDPVVL
jgi:hypothetical protein